nr:hypothetical protein RP007_05826 [Rhizobium sp. P007]
MWQDIVTAMADRKEWFDAVDELKDEDRATLEAARSAKSFADVDPGGSDRGARKRGKRKIFAANDNLMAAINKISA